jgi:hypothetical protein
MIGLNWWVSNEAVDDSPEQGLTRGCPIRRGPIRRGQGSRRPRDLANASSTPTQTRRSLIATVLARDIRGVAMALEPLQTQYDGVVKGGSFEMR